MRTIHPHRAALMKFDAYVASDFMWASLPRGTRRVQVFHGVGGKYGFDAPTRSMREWHRLFFVNERRLGNFVAAGAIDHDSPAIRLIGMPKVDCLVDGSIDRDRGPRCRSGSIRRCRRSCTRRRGHPHRRSMPSASISSPACCACRST